MSFVVKRIRFASANDTPMEFVVESDGQILLRVLKEDGRTPQAEVFIDPRETMRVLGEAFGTIADGFHA